VTTSASQTPTITLQGIQIPSSSVDAKTFQALTRRQNLKTKAIASFAGLGSTDVIPMLQTGIITYADVRLIGSVVVTLGGGTCATTYRWPYGLVKSLQFQANGQSNLINMSGWFLRAFALASRIPIDDRGVVQGVGGASPGTQVYQGTLSKSTETWGLGQGVTAIPGAPTTYNFDISIPVPIAYDQVSLMGAIFAQTTSSALQIQLNYETLANLFILTGAATAVVSCQVIVETTAYTIPTANGGIVVPNLSVFHSLIENTISPSVSNGLQEVILAGQGVGRQLMRAAIQLRNNANAAPIVMNDANYSEEYWRYGGNTTPEDYTDGTRLAEWNEGIYNCNMALQGFGFFDFSSLWAPRDAIDEGSVTSLRLGFNVANSVTLSSALGRYATEELVAGGAAA
jgi:hypothetical protein